MYHFTAADLGARVGTDALPVGVILLTSYQPDAIWKPRRLSAAHALVRMMAHTVAARRHPEYSVPILKVAVVQLTLQELAGAQLLAAPLNEVVRVSRRDLLRRGVAAAAIPAIYSIVAPSPADAQSAPPPGAPTLTSVSPNQGIRGERRAHQRVAPFVRQAQLH